MTTSPVGRGVRLVVAVLTGALVYAGCGSKSVRIVNKVKEIPISGARDTVYMERSHYWDAGRDIARSDSNRQVITFKPGPGQVAYITLQNMGGVPIKRDTIRGYTQVPAELYLRTGTLDTNMHMHIDFPDWRKPYTDVVIYIRNRDSVYREVLFSAE